MADNNAASDKEKQTAQQDEKEKDTAASGSVKGKSPTPSKAGSAKSAASGAAKPAAAKGGKAATKGGAKGKAKKKEEEEKPPEATPVPGAEGDALPEGAFPIFLSSMTQGIFDSKVDEDVTEENPFKFIGKEDIIQDLFNRAAISDFHPFKSIMQNYPADDILVMYDPEFKWGQNFVLASTEEAKAALLKGDEEEVAAAEAAEAAAEEEAIVYTYKPPTPKDWISQGSEKEIAEEALEPTRKQVKVTVNRKRREFGRYVQFSDRNVGDAKDAYQECTSFEDKTYDLSTIELTKGTQAIPEFEETASQTDWKYPRNACTQYYPREMSEEEKKVHLESDKLAEFMKAALPRFELALQQNHIMNVFYDDWMNLGDDDSSFGSKADNHLKEYQSFTDLQFSKDKTVTCIDWHPTIKGVVAVAVAEKMSFDERIDYAHKVIMTPSLILIWSFTDPIHPQLLLEAPDDILCFKFMPTDPNIICGGCINGQVVLWDISQHSERLKAPRGGKKSNNHSTLPGFEDENALDTPIVRYCAVSSIEHSHKAGITDIQWVPDHLEMNRMGIPHENQSGNNVQIMTCAIDHTVLVWDTRPPKTGHSMLASVEKKKDGIVNPMGVPNTFKHLDLTWKPHLKITLYKSEPGGDHSPTKFSITEMQGSKGSLSSGDDDGKKADPAMSAAGGFNFGGGAGGRQGSGKRTLSKVKSHFYIGTEDGELVYADWMPQKDQDTGKIQTPKPDYYHTLHDGAVEALQRSPFFRDIILVVGGWTFSIWKEDLTSGPILQSCSSSKKLTSGFWSPSRPGIFFITKQDGSIDTWDLLDRTHEPSMNQSVTPAPITCIFPYQVTNKQHLLAVGDSAGTLHILEIPWSLRQPTPNELASVSHYFEREIGRRGFVMSRWDFREKEKVELEQENKRKAGIAPSHQLTEEEQSFRMKQEYQTYCDEEAAFLRELGLKEVEEEPLPETD